MYQREREVTHNTDGVGLPPVAEQVSKVEPPTNNLLDPVMVAWGALRAKEKRENNMIILLYYSLLTFITNCGGT